MTENAQTEADLLLKIKDLQKENEDLRHERAHLRIMVEKLISKANDVHEDYKMLTVLYH